MNLDTSSGRDKSKFCRFHVGYGHTTDECPNLKDEIEKLVKKGGLNKFIRQNEDGRASYKRRRAKAAPKEKDRNEEDDLETLETINMIDGPEL